MAAIVNKTRSRVLRWFRRAAQQNKPPYRWYEVEHIGM